MSDQLNAKLVPGVKVQLSGKFLRNTGQFTGSAGLDKWTIRECDCEMCKSGNYVSTDEKKGKESLGYWTKEELEQYPSLLYKHIAKSNLKIVGQPSSRDA